MEQAETHTDVQQPTATTTMNTTDIQTLSARVDRLQRTTRRYRAAGFTVALLAIGFVAGGAQFGLGDDDDDDNGTKDAIIGFTAIDVANGTRPYSFFRLKGNGAVEMLDTSRPNKWRWRKYKDMNH